MKTKTICSLLCGCLFAAGCEGDYKIETPDFGVVPLNRVCKVGEPVAFSLSGSADFVLFYSGEFGNDYTYRDRERLTPARMMLSFDTKASTSGNARRFNPAYTPVSYSTDFNGQYDLENMHAATWTDISPCFAFPDPGEQVSAVNGAVTVSSGSVDITDYFPQKDAPIYLRFRYKVNRYENSIGRTTILISNFFINGRTAGGEVPIYSITDLDWHFVEEESWAGATGTTRLPGTQANLQFQCQWNTAQDREIWAVAGPVRMADDVNSGVEPAVCIKVVADPDLRSYSYVYTSPGTYRATFVAANANVGGRKEVVKQFTLTVIEDSGGITPPEQGEWPN